MVDPKGTHHDLNVLGMDYMLRVNGHLTFASLSDRVQFEESV